MHHLPRSFLDMPDRSKYTETVGKAYELLLTPDMKGCKMSDVRVYKRLALGLAMAIAAVLFVVFLSGKLLRLFAPALLALFVAWLMDPIVRFVNRKTSFGHKISAIIVTVLCFIIVGGIIFGLVYGLISELLELSANLDSIIGSIEKFFSRVLDFINERAEALPENMNIQLRTAINNLMNSISVSSATLAARITKNLSGYALRLTSWIVFAAVFIIGTFMFSFRIPMYRAGLAQRTRSNPNHPVNLVTRVLRSGLGGYMRATLILGGWVAALCMIGFFIMGQPYAVLLGVLMGICDILPNFGSGTVMLPWAVIALATGNTEKAVMLGVTVAVVGITRNMIYPQVMGSQTGLSPLLTVITVFVGWKLWGVLGMIIGPIIALIIVKVFQSGIFGGVVSDLKVLFSDISRKLTGLGGDYR